MACPLFRRDKLDAFMRVYDRDLVGYGMDWWFLHTLGPDIENRVAVVDEVTCVNPYDKHKGSGGREIDALQTHEARKEVWERLKAKHQLTEQGRVQHEFGRVNQSPLGATFSLLSYFPDWAHLNAKSLARRLVGRGRK
jgi:hypothetical protein